jgi:uroporphyrinogen-III decarboxylase
MTTNPIDKIINDAKSNLAEKVKKDLKTSEQITNQVFELAKDAYIRLLESEASAGHFDEFLKIYNGVATSLSVSQITSLMEYFYAKKLRDSLKLSDVEATKITRIVLPFIMKQVNSKKSSPAKDIKTLCTQMGLDSCITNLEALKKKWDDLSPEEKKLLSR